MKKFILLILLSGSFLFARAQDSQKPAFSIGPEMNIPSNSVYSFGYGASAKIEIPVINQFALSLTGEYTTMNYKGAFQADFNTQASSKFIPLKAGIRYGGVGGLFLEAEGGTVIETTGNKDHLFAFSIGPGFRFPLSPKQDIELGFRYEKWSKNVLTQTGIRVAYRLGW